MKTISCHRKYQITTNFLDTMLEHSVVIEEGESKLDAFRRGLKELDQIAAELRKEANQPEGVWEKMTDLPPHQKTQVTFAPTSIPTRNRRNAPYSPVSKKEDSAYTTWNRT